MRTFLQNEYVIQIYFLTLTLVVALVWVAGFWRAAPGHPGRPVIGMIGWLAFTGALSVSGILQNFDRLPPPLGVLMVGASVLTAVLVWSPAGTRMLNAVSIPLIVGCQVFRLGVEIFLWLGSQTRLVPPQLTLEGRNWDILTGLAALPVAWLAMRGRIGRTAVMIWNWFGLGLLLNVVVVAVLSFPTPLQQFEPANRFVATLPYVWLPTVLVQAAWFSHLLLFRQLSKKR